MTLEIEINGKKYAEACLPEIKKELMQKFKANYIHRMHISYAEFETIKQIESMNDLAEFFAKKMTADIETKSLFHPDVLHSWQQIFAIFDSVSQTQFSILANEAYCKKMNEICSQTE